MPQYRALALTCVLLLGCGGKASAPVARTCVLGGADTSTGLPANVVGVTVDDGPDNIKYTNGLFVTMTLCEPGTNNCQTIDHILVDTGSYGVRILESVLCLPLPPLKNANGAALAECTQFVDGTMWGPIVTADVKLGGETSAGIPIQTVGLDSYPMPSTGLCASGSPITDFQSLAANGILGVGTFQEDCGTACALGYVGAYFACTSSQSGGCKATPVPLDLQVRNPIVGFPVDNNGLIIQLPPVPDTGQPSVSGTLTFGIGTQSNNALGTATVLTPIDQYGNLGTDFPAPVDGTIPANSPQYKGYIDSGSNAFFFLDSGTTGLTKCATGSTDFYCPLATTKLSASIVGGNIVGGNMVRATVNFSIANANRLSASVFAISDLGGPMPGFPFAQQGAADFLWGLTFFFGRTVYTAIENAETPGGTGPYVAF